MRERHLFWDGCLNVRDLGGLPLEDGGETRFGSVVRADSIRLLTETGWAALAAYGTRTVVDLRSEAEIEADPPRELDFDLVRAPVPNPTSEPWRDTETRSAPDPVRRTGDLYLEYLERRAAEFGAALTAVAQADGGAVLVHCAGGKDRTGLVCALLLRVAGVRVDAIAEDYSFSERNLQPQIRRWLERAEDEAERERRWRVSASPAGAMLQVLAAVDERYGGVEGYLRAAGVPDDCPPRLRARLRG